MIVRYGLYILNDVLCTDVVGRICSVVNRPKLVEGGWKKAIRRNAEI